MSDRYQSFQKFMESQRPSDNVEVQPPEKGRRAMEMWQALDAKRKAAGLPPMDPHMMWNFPSDMLLHYGFAPNRNY